MIAPKVSGKLPPRVPQEQRTQWVFRLPCGCPVGLVEGTRIVKQRPVTVATLTEDEAWDRFADTRAEERDLRRRGVVAEHMSHARYSAEMYPLMLARCPHGGAS